MPKKLEPINELNFTNIAPSQVRISAVLEIGADFTGELPAWLPTWLRECDCGICCESCDCVSCDSQSAGSEASSYRSAAMAGGPFAGNEIKIRNLKPGPIKIAKDIVYERVQEADAEHGEAVVRRDWVILEMPKDAYDRMPEKDLLVEVGTAGTGAKQYLLNTAVTKPK